MQPYQLEYIENCKTYHTLASLPLPDSDTDAARFLEDALRNRRRARALADRNTMLIQQRLLPVLDDLYQQDEDTLRETEEFADALVNGLRALDLALADQLHEALLSVARRRGRRETIIRELYKLGMVRFRVWNLFTGLSAADSKRASVRMKYCFLEASGYLKYYDEFDEETKGYILRSLANNYLGDFEDWREKLACVRRSMEVFNDERYQAAAPGLPWGKYIHLIHRQMTSVLPFNFPEGENPTPEDVVDVMESAHLIYELQYEKAARSGEPIHAHRLTPYYAVEFACGLITRQELLANFEPLMDRGDPSRYDDGANYAIISMPAFYVQYLKQMPDLIPPRHDYIVGLYRRMLRYIETMPAAVITDQTRLYVRQELSQFLELEGGVPYRDLALTVMRRMAPELYTHGYAVGKMACVLCAAMLQDNPTCFDDIPEIAAVADPDEKARAMEDLAFHAGLLHDMGKLSFTSLYNQTGRQLFSTEEETLRLHADAGRRRLEPYPSTRLYAPAAHGHHRWYDGSDGYPNDYIRSEDPCRVLVDVIAVADFLDSAPDDQTGIPLRDALFEDKVQQALRAEGRQLSPLVTLWLREPTVLAPLEDLYQNGRQEGYRHCFQNAGM